MKLRSAARFARSAWLLSLALTALFVVLVIASRGSAGPLDYDETPLLVALYAGLMVMFPSLGALIASRHPANAIGWMFCVTGITLGAGMCVQLYADYALFKKPGSLPAGDVAAWISSWLIPAGLFVTPMFLLFLFPTGRPPSRRWAPVIKLLIALLAAGFAGWMLKPGPIEPLEFGVKNPAGLEGRAGDVMTSLYSVFSASPIAVLVLGVVALVSRMRTSSGEQRQQLKWFVYVASIMGVAFAASFSFSAAGSQGPADFFFLLGALALVCIPVASALAILRYRLYDIDVIINRTLVYVVLTATLALAYFGAVVLLQQLFAPITPQSDLAIAGSTLAVAALFRPARSRIQRFIDHRFYRRKYDAATTLETFGRRLRDQIELDSLSAEVLAVVNRTMQPAHASLWLRQPGRPMDELW